MNSKINDNFYDMAAELHTRVCNLFPGGGYVSVEKDTITIKNLSDETRHITYFYVSGNGIIKYKVSE